MILTGRTPRLRADNYLHALTVVTDDDVDVEVAVARVLQWVPIPMGTQYPPIPMGKWVGNGYGLGHMGGYEGPRLYND
jgi:hypothetical protein